MILKSDLISMKEIEKGGFGQTEVILGDHTINKEPFSF
jgi:hypothetical protein